MTVSSSTSKVIGGGNGVTTSWPFAFQVFDATHLVVTYTNSNGDETTLDSADYGVALNADQDTSPGGSVSYSPAIASGTKLTILRSVPSIQATDINNQGGFFPEVLERAFDLVVMQVQQVREQLARALKLSPSQSSIGELQASDANRANMLLGFDAGGMLAVVSGGASAAVSSVMQAVVGAASLVAARAAMAVGGLADNNTWIGTNTWTGTATMSGKALNEAKATAIASVAGVTDIWAANGNLVHITGTNNPTGFGVAPQAGLRRRVVFDGVLTIANNASIDTGIGRPITTQAGDSAEIVADTTTRALITSYRRVDGTSSLPHRTMVRQTVMAGPLDSAGLPNFLPATSGTLSLTAQNISAVAPLVVAAANGFGEIGPVDRVVQVVANPQWTGLTASRAAATPNFLYVTVNADGTLSPGSTLLAPVYQWGGTVSTAAGQFTFNIAEMRGYLGNGTSAPQAHVVFVGEAATSGGGVIGTVVYAYNGRYDSGFTAPLPSLSGGYVSRDSNLGLHPSKADLILECIATDGGWSVGDRLHTTSQFDGSVTARNTVGSSRNTIGFVHSTWVAFTKSTSFAFNPAVAKWQYKLVADRGW